MNKSLAPLIISFAVIILLTLVIVNSKPRGSAIELQTEGPTMVLNQYSKPQQKKKTTQQKETIAYSPNTEKNIEEARKLLSLEKEDQAEDILRTLLVFEPDNKDALSLFGGILYYSRRYADAEMVFRRLVKLSPDNEAAYNHLGSTLARQLKMDPAIEAVLKALEINPDSSNAHINVASMFASKGDKESCMKHLVAAYNLIGSRILPFTYDQAFDKVRSAPEFQELISRARDDHEKMRSKTSDVPVKQDPETEKE